MKVKDVWYGWIPTNLGKIQFDFIDESNLKTAEIKKDFFSKKDNPITINLSKIKFLSDTSLIQKILGFFSKKEHYSSSLITIEYENNIFKGSIDFQYQDIIKFNINFILEDSGKVEFRLIKIQKNKAINLGNVSNDIKQIIYVLLKVVIHGDNHHHQKIDTALTISKDNFDSNVILDSMLLHLKRIERNIKVLKTKCSTRLRQNTILYEIDGYLSYIETFVLLFKNENDKELENKLKIANNIKQSLESLIKKREKKFESEDIFKTTFLTIFALIFASNMFFNAYLNLGDPFGKFNRVDIVCYTSLFWLVIYFFYIKCKLKSWLFYNNYKLYRFFKALYDITKNTFSLLLGIILVIISFTYIVYVSLYT